MELLIYNYSGVESEFEVAVLHKGKIDFAFYVTDIKTTLSLDEDGHGKVSIESISCVTYDNQDEAKPYVISEDLIWMLEKELPEYINWTEWVDHNSQSDDDYEENRFNQMD